MIGSLRVERRSPPGHRGTARAFSRAAVAIAPFERLRGMDVVQLRSGGVRALRTAAVPAPYPQSEAPNPDDLPTWTSPPCVGVAPGDSAAVVLTP